MKGKWGLLTGAVAAGTMLASMGAAEAGVLAMSLQSGATLVSITDNAAGDNSGAAGVINFSGAVGAFGVNVTTGFGLTALTPPYPHLDLNSVNLSSSGPATITLMLSETGLSGAGILNFLTQWGGTTNGSVSLDAYVNLDDGLFSTTGTQVANFDSLAPGLFGFDGTGGAATDASYSVTLVWTITHTAAGQITSGDAEFRQVPAPAAIGLLGLGLLGLGAATRRRKAA